MVTLTALIMGAWSSFTGILAGFGFIGCMIQELLHIPLGIV